MGALILVALIKCTSAPVSESPFSIQENSEGLELSENGKPVLFYHWTVGNMPETTTYIHSTVYKVIY